MNYSSTLNYMFKQLPMFQRQGKTAFKKDLTNIKLLCKHLQNPQNKFKSIHVAGTNGKGSTSHILASLLQTAGYKVGLYTSPHLKDFRERIRLNGKMISENEVVSFIKKNKAFFEDIKPSFFEITVAMAFNYFFEQKVDIAIIETGLGGRLDSTNIITPIISVITNISFDHTQFLGNTIKEIAFEKAGIIKKNIPIVIGETQKDSSEVFKEISKNKNSKIYFADEVYKIENSMLNKDYKQVFNVEKEKNIVYENLQTDLLGLYQKKNVVTSLKVINLISEKFNITENNIYDGLLNVKKNTGFAGRWNIIDFNPLIVADTGHNIAGISEVITQLKATEYKKLHFIYGSVNDKDIENILKLLPKDAIYYFTQAKIPRALNAKILQEKAKKYNLKGEVYNDTTNAFKNAERNAERNDLILIGGSTFIVAELI